jgi:hypothetical protein
MSGSESPEMPVTETGGISRPRPPFCLETRRVNAPPYGILEEGDPFYEVAAFACRYQDRLDDDAFADLFSALAADWPRSPGRHVGKERLAMDAFILSQHCSLVDVAAQLMVSESYARRLVKEGRSILVDGFFCGRRSWRVEPDPGNGHGHVYVRQTEPSPREARAR